MASRMQLQSMITLTGDTTSGDVVTVQPMDLWASLGHWGAAVFTIAVVDVQVASGDDVDFTLATLGSKSGIQRPVPDGAGGNIETIRLTLGAGPQWYKVVSVLEQTASPTNPATMPIDDWVLWAVGVIKGGSGGAFSITFEVSATLKWPV